MTLLNNSASSPKKAGFPQAPQITGNGKFKAKPVSIMCHCGFVSHEEPDRLSGKRGGTYLLDRSNPTVNTAYGKLEDSIREVIANATGSAEVPPGINLPIRSNNEQKADGSYVFKGDFFRGENKVIVTARTGFDINFTAGPARSPCEPSAIEGGDLVMIEVSPYWYSQGANSGVGLGLSAVWLLEKGKVKVGRGAAAGSTFANADLGGFSFAASGDYE